MPPADRHFGQRDGEAAVGKIVHRRHAGPRRMSEATKSPLRRSAARSTGGGAPSSRPANVAQIGRLAEPARRPADQQDRLAGRLEGDASPPSRRRRSGRRRRSPASAECPTPWSRCRARHCRRRRESRAPAPLRRCLRGSRRTGPSPRGFSGIAEIEIVGQRQRPRADRDEIAPASATACLPPSKGRPRNSAASRRSSARGPSARRRGGSPPRRRRGPAIVLPRMSWSYCSQTQRFEQRSGDAEKRSSASRLASAARSSPGRGRRGSASAIHGPVVERRLVAELLDRQIGLRPRPGA